ncbi:MAG: dTDP-4-dehydrorhamnose reductase [Longimicrobiales bacterium]
MKQLNAVVTGAGGLLSHALLRRLEREPTGNPGNPGNRVVWRVSSLSRADLDVTDRRRVDRVLESLAPDVVFHCAAYTAVDKAESDEAEAHLVNGAGTQNVADRCAQLGALLVYPSTDFVFGGTQRRPYLVDYAPDPINAYGRSKLAGEVAVLSSGVRHLIARTSWLYGAGGNHFVDTMIRLGRVRPRLSVVDDQVGRPTWTNDLANDLVDLVEDGAQGTFHVAGGGSATWFQLAEEALRLAGVEVEVEPVTTEAFGAPAPRPAYSVLDVSATEKRLGREMSDWRTSLRAYLTGARKVSTE